MDLIQSVDSAELVRLIGRRAVSLGLVQDVLIEVSIAGEAQKSGVAPAMLDELLALVGETAGIRARGLMCVPPISEKIGGNRKYFAEMRQLFVDISDKKYDNNSMDFLSMGMSDDYPDAVAEGANMIRVGSAIFGARDYGTA